MDIKKHIVVDLWQKNQIEIPLVQYEVNGRDFVCEIQSDGQPVNLTGVSVQLILKRPKAKISYLNVEVEDAANGVCSFTPTSQMTNSVGDVQAWFQFVNGNETRSRRIVFHVEHSPDIAGAVESTSEFTALLKAIKKVQQGGDGKSAYDLWIGEGNTGSVADFLASLKATIDATSLEPYVTITDTQVRQDITQMAI